MTTKHTPGPWSTIKYIRTTLVCDANGNWIAAIKPVRKFGIAGDDAANARLIAAAPELLAALDAFTQWNDRDQGEGKLEDALNKARAAIAKAKGE